MLNIFRNAQFGDKFITEGYEIAILQEIIANTAYMFTKDIDYVVDINDGMAPRTISQKYNIVSKYIPPINEDDLNILALNYANNKWATSYKSISEIKDELDLDVIDDFKAGYRKAQE